MPYLALPQFHQFQLLGSYSAKALWVGLLVCICVLHRASPSPVLSAGPSHVCCLEAALGAEKPDGFEHFPDPRFSGPYQHCRGMDPRSLLFQNLRACLSLLLTLGAIGYVSAVGRTPVLAGLAALGVACAFSPAPPQRRAFPPVRHCFC